MDGVAPNKGEASPCVEVVEACGEWFVRVIDGNHKIIRSFEIEQVALTFAEGQRIRLGLDQITRI